MEPATPDVRRLSRREVYANPWMSLTEDDVARADGSTGSYAVLHSPDFVLVIPFDGERYHLVEQYRYPIGARRWEFPQGSVASSEPVPPEELARIELAQETGLTARRMQVLGYLHHDYGRSSSGFHVVFATDLTSGPSAREPEEQDMRCAAFTLAEIWEFVANGQLTDASSLAGLALLERWRLRPAPTASE